MIADGFAAVCAVTTVNDEPRDGKFADVDCNGLILKFSIDKVGRGG